MKIVGEKHWSNTREGKRPLPAHNTIPGKSSDRKAMSNRWKRRKTRADLKLVVIQKVINESRQTAKSA